MNSLYIVTGAGSGIGQAIAEVLLKDSTAKVLGLGRSLEKLKKTQDRLGPRFLPYSVDLSSLAQAEEFANEVQGNFEQDPLKGLVNNAGIFEPSSFAKASDEIWLKQYENNLMSAVRLSRALYPKLKASAPSSVLNISSTLGLRPVAGTSAYSAIKAAMISLTECMALEWAADKIRVNCIAPGIVDTPIHSFHSGPEAEKAKMHSAQPIGRMGQPQDIALAARFLLSEESSWTTGSVLSVDGGIHL